MSEPLTISKPIDQTPSRWQQVFDRHPVGSQVTYLGIPMVVSGHQRGGIFPAVIWCAFIDPAIFFEYVSADGKIQRMTITSANHPAISDGASLITPARP